MADIKAYYNDVDAIPAEWLTNLTNAGHLPAGLVDHRSIEDVQPEDLTGFQRAHFFAGLGMWAKALQLVGWGDTTVWTGSCPCQPFSAPGKHLGTSDERHLWPEFRRLIAVGRPPIIFGEQVASKDGRTWLSDVRLDLEALGYWVGASDISAAGVGAPHQRQRLYWGAVSPDWLADTYGTRLEGLRGNEPRIDQPRRLSSGEGRPRPSNSGPDGLEGLGLGYEVQDVWGVNSADVEGLVVVEEPWPDVSVVRAVGERADWFLFRHPTGVPSWRPAERGTLPLDNGSPGRVGRMRAYGNTIVPQVAATFISSFMEAALLGATVAKGDHW